MSGRADGMFEDRRRSGVWATASSSDAQSGAAPSALLGLAQRVTYVIGSSQRVLRAFHHEIRINKHRDDVLRFVDELRRTRSAPTE